MQRFSFGLFLIALALSTQTVLAQDTKRYTEVADHLVALINSADHAGIEKLFSKEMTAALPLEKSKPFFNGLTAQLGKIQKLEKPTDVPGGKVFVAHFERGVTDIQLSLNEKSEIAGLYFKPHTAVEAAPPKH